MKFCSRGFALGILALVSSSCATPRHDDKVDCVPQIQEPMSDERSSPDPRFGPWKLLDEIELEDLIEHPVWAWCMALGLPDEEDGPIGGDETSMRPLITTKEVPMDHIAPPLILLSVRGTPFHASGMFDAKTGIVDAVCIFQGAQMVPPSRVPDLPDPATYVSVPFIAGEEGVEFEATAKGADTAKRRQR